jgi:phosphoribosylaminoimidazole carboxylase
MHQSLRVYAIASEMIVILTNPLRAASDQLLPCDSGKKSSITLPTRLTEQKNVLQPCRKGIGSSHSGALYHAPLIKPLRIYIEPFNSPSEVSGRHSSYLKFETYTMERTIGLLGGGQLGQMLCEAANPLGIKVVILDAGHSPAKQINARNPHLDGSFKDEHKIKELARQCDILTVEIEHVDTHVLEDIAENGVEVVVDGNKRRKMVEVQPSWRTLRTIQDKYLQKHHLSERGVAIAQSMAVESTAAGLKDVGAKYGYPFMLKARKDAYDGRGNFPVMSESDIEEALSALGGRALYAEKWAKFKMELAVMVVKTANETDNFSATTAYPAVETIHEDSVCKLVYAPARNVPQNIREEAQELARKAVSTLWGKGVFGVELFLMEDDSIVVNEIAPRPHNSGHYTIESCPTLSQYKAQLLSILGLLEPAETIDMDVPAAIMLNILGGARPESHVPMMKGSIALKGASLHMYGKDSKPGRKIGHITVLADSMPAAEKKIAPLLALADDMRAERKKPASSSTSASAAATSTPKAVQAGEQPLVAVTMGSDSDLPVLKPGLALLRDLSIPFSVTITSAHRTPQRMAEFALDAASNGLKVIIAAAGGAAHLPGMVAAHTALPVIGVPVKGSTLDGMDSLLSIVQMPRGVPVATVAINNSINAALLAAKIIGASDLVVRKRVEAYMKDQEEGVYEKVEKLNQVGWEVYGAK